MEHTSVTAIPTVSVHDPTRRAPRTELTRLIRALERYPLAAADQRAATRLLEEEVAQVLGKPAAVLMPTGKMAQQIALRIHADRRPGRRVVLAHPANHLTLWEDENYSLLHGLRVRHVGDPHRLLSVTDINAAMTSDDVAAGLWELPQRELGGELPPWPDLQAQLAAATHPGAAKYLDGARIWQAEPFYAKRLKDICAGFDSVYVSLYKDLEAPRGAMLAGDGLFVAAARTWRHRMGGTIDEAWPLALLALDGLQRVSRTMPEYVAHAQALAAAISARTPATVHPVTPQVAMFHLHLPVPAESARRAHEQMIREGGLRLTLRIRTAADPRRSWCELTIGESALPMPPEQVADAVTRLIDIAANLPAPSTDPDGKHP